MSWILKSDPQAQLETALLRQWRGSRLQDHLSDLPIGMVLATQLRQLKRTEEENLARMGCLPVHRRLKRLIRLKIESGISKIREQFCRRSCLRPVRRFLVQSQRRFLVWVLVRLLRLMVKAMLSPGKQPPCGHSSMSSSKDLNSPESKSAKLAQPRPGSPNGSSKKLFPMPLILDPPSGPCLCPGPTRRRRF